MKKYLGVLLAATLCAAPVAAQTINNLGVGAAVSGTDMFPAYQGANPAKRVTAAQINTYIQSLWGAGYATFLTTPSSTNLHNYLTDEVGTSAFYTVGGALGTPASATLTNGTGLPISTGLTGAGTGILTALGVNVGTAGAPVINGGALGTPSSGTLTNATGLPLAGVTGWGTGVVAAAAAALNSSTGLVGALTPTSNNCIVGNGTAWTSTTCPGGGASGANPTATAGPTAVNGVSSNFMRADAAPAIQQGSSSQKGIVQVDGTTITATAGVISAVGGSGTVTSVGASCGNVASPNPITTSGTIDAGISIRTVSTTSDTVLAADCGNLVNYTNAGSVAVTLPQAGTAGFATRAFFQFCSQGAGTTTITPTTSTIGGALTKTLTGGTAAAPVCVGVISDGTNYQLVPSSAGGGGGTPGGSSGQIQYNNAGAFGGFTQAGDCTTAVPNIRCNLPNSGIVSNRWYRPIGRENLTFGGTPQANTIACHYAIISRLVTIKALAFYNNVAGSTNVQMAIYANDPTTGRPAALIGNTGNVSNTTTGAHSGALLANKQLGPGGADGGREVWFCSNNGDTTATYGTIQATSGSQSSLIGATNAIDVLVPNDNVMGLYCQTTNCNGGSSTLGTWPSTLAGTTWSTEQPSNTGLYSPNIAYQAN